MKSSVSRNDLFGYALIRAKLLPMNKSSVRAYIDELTNAEDERGVEESNHSFYLQHKKSDASICVLMIHGFISAPQETKYMANSCHQSANVDVVSICLPGHGSKPEAMKECRSEDWIQAGIDAYNLLLQVYDDVVLIGVSMGALVAIQCSMVQQPLGMVCVAPALIFSDWRLRIGGPAAPVITKLSSKLGLKTVKAKLNDINKGTVYPYFPIEATVPLYKLSASTRKKLHHITCPLLISHSKEDPVIRPESAELLFNSAQSIHKHLIWSVGEHNFVALPNIQQQKAVEAMVSFCEDPVLYFDRLNQQ